MSGHNKWSKIKHKKAKEDSKKSKVFSKFSTLITMESKKCNGDKSSPALKAIIERARAENMALENIERAVQRGSQLKSGDLVSCVYEAYGPGGVAMLIQVITDNKNRSAAEIRHALSVVGLELATNGSALWLFNFVGEEYLAKNKTQISDKDKGLLKNTVENLLEIEGVEEVYTTAEQF